MDVRRLRKGQQVRLIYTGTVGDVYDLHDYPWARIDDATPGSTYGLAVTELSPYQIELIEPDYKDGEVYRDNHGSIYVYHANTLKGRCWTGTGTTNLYEFGEPERPMVHLVPESQEV